MQINIISNVNGSNFISELNIKIIPKMALSSLCLSLCSLYYRFGHEMRVIAVNWVGIEHQFGLVVLYQQV